MIKKLKAYILNRKKLFLMLLSLSLLLIFALVFSGIQKKNAAVETASDGEQSGETEIGEIPTEENYLFTVCIDAGHGGKDRGSDSRGRIEKTDCLALSLAVAEELQNRNAAIRVLMTREGDDSVSLSDRCSLANQENADYLLSIHRNKGKGNGVETWISKNAAAESKALADAIMKGLSDVGISRDRGVKVGSQSSRKEDYYVNRNARMPSCLLEIGFVNSAEDNDLFDRNMDAYAGAICDAILSTYDLFHTQNPQEAYLSEHDVGDASVSQLAPVAPCSLSDPDFGLSGDIKGQAGSGDDLLLRTRLFGKRLRTEHTPSDETDLLDTTCIEYVQGSQTADRNRPSASLECQARYAAYNARFIGTDPLMTESGKKTLYLTFNERYERGYTEHILDVLKENDVRATFFVTLFYAQENPALIRRMLNEGHVIGNLSATNPADGLPSQSVSEQKHEVLATHVYLKNKYHYTMYLFRFPAGLFSERSLAVVNNLNYQSVFWSFSHMDYVPDAQPDPQEAYDKFIARLHPGGIYMLRGESETNSAIIEEFIEKAKSLGYEFCIF